jgi:DNA-binding response OmpR family regulator
MKKQSILVIENDIDTLKKIQEAMREKNENVGMITSNMSSVAIDMAWKETPDLIVLGSSSNDLSSLEVIGILKKNKPTSSIPILMLGKLNTTEEEIEALEKGANDYIKKPLHPKIFILRIDLILKNASKHIDDREEILKSGKITINMSSHTTFVSSKKIDLTPKELALLYLFIKKKNKVLNRVFLSETIWEQTYSTTSQTIDKHIANLRKKLGDEGQRILTLPTVGYKFIEE